MDMDMDMDMDVDMDMDMDIDVYHRPNLELACNVGCRLFRIKSAATPPTPPPHRPQYGHVTILYCTAL